MTLWIDAMLSPTLARWITTEFDGVEAASVEHLDLRHASDATIFDAAREADAIVLTKDSDYVDAVQRCGPPPAVIWVRAGNTSTKAMKRLLSAQLPTVLGALRAGESVVELVGQ